MGKKTINVTDKIENRFRVIRILSAILIALAITFMIIFFVSASPMETMTNFLFGPLKSVSRLGNMVEIMTPLIFTGVGVSIMYSANQTNMASEGAFFLGGVATAYLASMVSLPFYVHPIVIILVSSLVGALVTTIPAYMFVKLKSNVVVSSLMINYVVLYIGLYLINYVIRDPEAGYLASYVYKPSAVLPTLIPNTHVHIGFVLALLMSVLGYFFLMKSKWGYAIRMVGSNSNFSHYSGINVPFVILMCQIVGGGIAGMGGAVEQLGMYNRFQYQSLSGHGFDGIMIAILARYNPKYIPLAALFLAYVRVGADVMSRTSDVPVEIVSVIQAVIIVFVAAEKFLDAWKHRTIVDASKEQLVLKEAQLVMKGE